jgi:hypothetical protein
MKMNLAMAVTSLSFVIATPVYAQDTAVQVVPIGTASLSPIDEAKLFSASQAPVQVAVLSNREMKETEGAIVPLLVRVGGGAAIGAGAAIGHHFYQGGSWNNVNWGNVGYAAGVGAVGGAWGRFLKVSNY